MNNDAQYINEDIIAPVDKMLEFLSDREKVEKALNAGKDKGLLTLTFVKNKKMYHAIVVDKDSFKTVETLFKQKFDGMEIIGGIIDWQKHQFYVITIMPNVRPQRNEIDPLESFIASLQ